MAASVPAERPQGRIVPWVGLAVVAFFVCFIPAIVALVQQWISIPDAAHGILIAPVALWMAWKTGFVPNSRSAPLTGSFVIAVSVALYVVGRTAGVATAPSVALIGALFGLTLWYAGWRQVIAWWLPFVLLALTVPLPESLIAWMTLPLQGVAAKMGAGLLAWRHIPVLLSGNVIRLPGHTLFVSEACSGLRSLTALVSMAILVGALFLRKPVTRIVMLAVAVALAVLVNGIRVFLTGFMVIFIDPKLGEGFMHLTEGYLLFLVSLTILALLTWFFTWAERKIWGDTPGTTALSERVL